MAAVVVSPNEIMLGGVFYPITRPVQPVLASVYPGRVVIGDTTRDSNPNASTLALSDFRGGIGLERMAGADGVDRVFWSTAQLSHQGHMVLPPLATQTADPSITGAIVLGELSAEVYAAWGTSVRKYNNATDSWGSSLHTLPAAATDSITVRLNDVVYLVFATTSGFTYTSDGSTFVDSIVDAKYLALWDDKLFLIDDDGLLKYVTDLAEVISESGTVSGVETNGSAALDDTGAVFTSAIRDGNHWLRVHDNTGRTLTGFIGTADPDTDDTRVQLFNSPARTTQSWVEGGATAFDMSDTPLTFEVYKVTDDAQLPLQSGSVNRLFTYRDAAGELILYAATIVGLYAHDFANTKFLETELGFPKHEDNGRGATKWRDAAFISTGLGVYRYQTGDRAVVTVMGPDRDDGLPSDRRGVIRQLVGTHNALVAALESTAAGGWDVSRAVFKQLFSVSAQDTSPSGLFFKPDGLKMYVVGNTGDTVEEYDLDPAWDISTAVHNQSLDVSTEDTAPRGLFFKPDGTKMYVLGGTGGDVNEYDLGPAWDISTAVHNQSFDWGASPATASGLFFKPDGTKMYITGLVDQRVYEYDLGTAWDVSTAVLTQSFFQTSGGSVTARDVFFKPDGTKMYVSDSNNEDVHEYDLSTAWDVSTAVFNQSFDVSNEDGESRGIFFKPDGTKMYVVGDDGNDVNEYDILSSPTILAWDERGWQVLWAEAEAGEDIDHLLVSSAYSEYRLWWGSNNLVYFMPLQRDISNPNQIPDYEYALEAETITPWFTAGQVEVDKLALRILAETIIGDAADSVTVSYGTDYSEAWTALTAITSSGKTEFTLPSTASPVGVAFRAIRFRIELARDNSSPASDKLRTPDLVSLTLEYRKKLPVKWGHSVTVSINGPHKGNTAKQLQAALKTAIDSKTLLEFAFHPNDASDESYFVDIAQVHGLEFSGRDYRGEISLMLVER